MLNRRLKILHTVESYIPSMHGMAEVVRQLSECLVKQGHSVTVATSKNVERRSRIINGVIIESFDLKGKAATKIEGNQDLYTTFLLNSQFDIIVNFAAQQWATDICLGLLDKLTCKKVFVPTGFSGLFDPVFEEYYREMKTNLVLYNMNVFLSDRYKDIEFARANNITNTCIIPNGASSQEFLPLSGFNFREKIGIPGNKKIILHVGSYTGVKGHDQAADIFLSSTDKNSVLVFVGQNFNEASAIRFRSRFQWFAQLSKISFYRPWAINFFWKYIKLKFSKKRNKIYLLSLNRSELIAAYQQSDLLLFPSMIECSPIVLFEAMASRTPFLVTDVGNSNEIIEWSRSGMLLPTLKDRKGLSHAHIKQSALLLDKIIQSDVILEDLAEKGYSSWLKNFTWENIAKKYEQLYYNLLGIDAS